MERIQPYAVLRVHARLVRDSDFGGHRALLESLAGVVDSDAELNAHADQLQEPVLIEDSQFGTFELDRRIEHYKGKAAWHGQTIELSLFARTPDEVAGALDVARELWREQIAWNR